MKNINQILENYYQPLKETKNNWDFVVALSDYVNYIKQELELNPIIEDIKKERQKDYKEYFELKEKSLKEINQAKKKLLKIINNNKINFEELNNIIKKLKNFEEGKITISGLKIFNIENYLFEICKALSQKGYKDLLKEFINDERKPQNIYGNFVFSRSLFLFKEELEKIEHLKTTEIWHCWYKLKVIPETTKLLFREIVKNSIRHSKKEKEEDVEYSTDFMHLKEEAKNDNGCDLEKEKSEYKNCCRRLNNYIIQKLEILKDKKTNKQKINYVVSFDENRGILFIGNGKTKIQKFNDQYHLLRIIFKNKKDICQEWFFSKIAEEYDKMANLPDKKFYNATYQLNQKIAIDTGIKDFFITTNQSLKINEKIFN